MREFMFEDFVGGNSFSGMTFKNAGNFYPDGSREKAEYFAKKVLDMTGFSYLLNRLAVMRAENHGNKVVFLGDMKEQIQSSQFFCDGVIFRGKGAAVFFPGGCAAIAFRDKKANLSGMLHAGWKPVAQNIIREFLRSWENLGGSSGTTEIKFLPSICNNCLVFDMEYFKHVRKTMEQSSDKTDCLFQPAEFLNYSIKDGRIHLSLSDMIVSLLYYNHGYVAEKPECHCCGGGKHWCYRCNDKNGVKYRNAAFIITG